MGHDHNHHTTRNIGIAFFLNLVFTVIEIIGGLYTNSVAILSDALHDLGDSISLGLSWYLDKVSKKKRDKKYSYGYGRFSLLGAFINGAVLISGSVIILFEAIPRLLNPEAVNAEGIIVISIIGILFNGAAVFKLKGGKTMNEKVVRWHLLEDVLGWVAVLVGGIAIRIFDLPIIDPILSVGVTLFVVINVFKNFIKTMRIFLQAIPDNLDLKKAESQIQSLDGVKSVHDTHVWSLDGEKTVISIHVVVDDDLENENNMKIKKRVREICKEQGILHATVEIEFEVENCELEDC